MVENVREDRVASDDEYRRLAAEHASYEQRLESLSRQSRLSDDELLEETRLKKLKLKVKDQMTHLERLRSTAVSAA